MLALKVLRKEWVTDQARKASTIARHVLRPVPV